jgi:hypothetical protein
VSSTLTHVVRIAPLDLGNGRVGLDDQAGKEKSCNNALAAAKLSQVFAALPFLRFHFSIL